MFQTQYFTGSLQKHWKKHKTGWIFFPAICQTTIITRGIIQNNGECK